MIQRILNSKNLVACLLAAATGMALYFKLPFPAENVFLLLMALRAPLVHEGLFYSYSLFLFTTPYIAYSIVLSGLYVLETPSSVRLPRKERRSRKLRTQATLDEISLPPTGLPARNNFRLAELVN